MLFAPLLSFAQWQAGKYQSICVIEAQDPEGDEIYFTITAGNSTGYYQITPCTGVVQVDTLAYNAFIRQKTWTITITCYDPQKNYSKKVIKITLRKDAQGNKLTPIVI